MLQTINHLIDIGEYSAASLLIKNAIRQNLDFGGRHISYANSIVLSCDWDQTIPLMPKDTNTLVTSGWLNSLQQRRPVNKENEPIPWLTYSAIDFIDSIIKKSWQVFEWGSGNSTLWWASKSKSVIAIEDNTDWFMEIGSQMPANATLYNKTDKDEYVNAISSYNDKSFDIIVIDGSHRNDCAMAAFPKVQDSGIIVFDNSDGKDFDESMQLLESQGFFRIDFWGLIPSYMYKNCTSVFFKDPSLFKGISPPSQHKSCVGISCFQAMDQLK